MIEYDIQGMIQRKLFASLSAEALENYRAANRRLANVSTCRESELAADAETKRKKAAVVVSAKSVTPEKARANIIAAYEKQHREGVSALSSAIERERESRFGKVAPVKAQDRNHSESHPQHTRMSTLVDLSRESAQAER